MNKFKPAHCAVLSTGDVARLAHAICALRDHKLAVSLVDMLAERSSAYAGKDERKRIAAFQDACPNQDGDTEGASEPSVSEGDDDGAYVLTWTWVSTSDAGLPSKTDDEPAS